MSLADAVADEVHRRMTALGMSQNGLARAAGIAPTLVHRALKGERQLQLDELERIGPALGVAPVWLILSAVMHLPPSGERSETNSESAPD